jgi:hypothetical protein
MENDKQDVGIGAKLLHEIVEAAMALSDNAAEGEFGLTASTTDIANLMKAVKAYRDSEAEIYRNFDAMLAKAFNLKGRK